MEPAERKKWLMSLTEVQAEELCRADWYERICHLRDREGMEQLRSNPPPKYQNQEKTSTRAYNGVTMPFKKYS